MCPCRTHPDILLFFSFGLQPKWAPQRGAGMEGQKVLWRGCVSGSGAARCASFKREAGERRCCVRERRGSEWPSDVERRPSSSISSLPFLLRCFNPVSPGRPLLDLIARSFVKRSKKEQEVRVSGLSSIVPSLRFAFLILHGEPLRRDRRFSHELA